MVKERKKCWKVLKKKHNRDGEFDKIITKKKSVLFTSKRSVLGFPKKHINGIVLGVQITAK